MLILKVIRTYEWAQGFNREHWISLVQIGHQSWSEATLTLMLLENSEKSFDWGKQNTPAAIPYKNIIRAIKVLALQEAGVPHAVASRISTSCHLRCKTVGPETSLSPHFTHTLHHVNHTTPSSKDFLLSTYTLTKTAQVMYIYIHMYPQQWEQYAGDKIPWAVLLYVSGLTHWKPSKTMPSLELLHVPKPLLEYSVNLLVHLMRTFIPPTTSWNLLLGKRLRGKAPKYVTGSPPVNNDAGPKFVTVAPGAKHTHRKKIAAPTCPFLDA